MVKMKNSKIIIAVTGASHTGKSTTAYNIARQMNDDGMFIKMKWEPDSNGDDIYAEFQINKVNIVILSQGDPNSGMEEALRDAIKQDFDVIICTCRTYGSTTKAVQSYYKSHDIFWLRSEISGAIGGSEISKSNSLLGMKIVNNYCEHI